MQLNFNPQGSREPRLTMAKKHLLIYSDFNPQGSREPRLIIRFFNTSIPIISIHKALASLDVISLICTKFNVNISIHKALASLDHRAGTKVSQPGISIHKALASLDV